MRFIARFAQEKENCFEVITVYDETIKKESLNKQEPSVISIASDSPAAVWFERKMSDDFGIKILYADDTRPLVRHEHTVQNLFPMRKAFRQKVMEHNAITPLADTPSAKLITSVTHPYHLESFQLHFLDKEQMISEFEMMPFYKHRGIEKMVEGMKLEEARVIVERISASQTIAYQTAFLDIELQASKKSLPNMVKKRHLFLLELERVITHLTDLSILCQLMEFSKGSEFFIKYVEKGRVIMQKLTGSRFGFSSVRVEADFLPIEEVYDFLVLLDRELHQFERWIEKRDKILKKSLLLGRVSKAQAIKYGLVGIMARSVGVVLDRRDNQDAFVEYDYHINMEEGGDVFARFNIRISEIFTSLRIMRSLVIKETLSFNLGQPLEDGEYYAYVESASGEVMMYMALKDGLIERFFLRDPSFLNAQILPLSLKNTNVTELGLIMKSIPLNISAIDL